MSVDLSLAVQQDVAVVANADPCSREAQLNDGWSCFRARGDQYHGHPKGSRLPTSAALGPTRLVAGVELPFDAFAVGARVGWAFRGIAPPSDGQEHALAFGAELLARVKLTVSGAFRLDLLGLVGVRELDAYARVKVKEDRSVPPSVYQLDNPDSQTLDAYKRLGTGFVGLGAGATLSLARWSAVRFELPLAYYFPTHGVAVSPALAWVVTP